MSRLPGILDDLVAAVTGGEMSRIAALLDDRPKRLHTYVEVDRPWGQELWLPLHHAAAAGRAEVVGLLLDRGGAPDCRTRYAWPDHARATPLHLGVAAGAEGVVRRLLDEGAELEVRDAYGLRPLHLAAPGSAIEAALIDRGADRSAAHPEPGAAPKPGPYEGLRGD